MLVGVWGVLPWLFLSLHCTGFESRGSHLTSHKNSGQMTIGLETERGRLRRLKKGAGVRLKNETAMLPRNHLWTKLDQQLSNENWVELSKSECCWSPFFLCNVELLAISCLNTPQFTNCGTSCTYAIVCFYKVLTKKEKMCLYTIIDELLLSIKPFWPINTTPLLHSLGSIKQKQEENDWRAYCQAKGWIQLF